MEKKGNIGVTTENIFPVIKQFLYSDHEIFLREMVSNAVDATQKMKTLASAGDFSGDLGDLSVRVTLDEQAGTLTISDRGIGMTAEEIDKYINQIAFSGVTDFLDKYKDKAEAIRESWLAGYVSSDYRIPMVRLPRGRKEQQYRIAGDRAAKIAWQVYAKAVIDVLHYGPDRLERLRKESHANYEQLNKWGHEDGLDVAMEKLRRCAAEAMQAPEMEVSDIDGSKDAAEVDKEFRKQQLNFIKRVRAQTLGRIAATTQPVNVLAEQGVQDKVQQIMQQVSQQSFERRRRR